MGSAHRQDETTGMTDQLYDSSRGVNSAPMRIAVGITNGCCGVAVAYQRPPTAPTVGGRRKRERPRAERQLKFWLFAAQQ